jgi:cardiolipin synthase (CMP-forming)
VSARVNGGQVEPWRGRGYRAADLVRLPGLVSWCRLPLAVAFPLAYSHGGHAVALLAAAALTDVIDGWLARRLHQETSTGALLDGVMDKLFAVTVIGTLVLTSTLSWLEVLLLGARELGEGMLIVLALWLRPRPTTSPRSAGLLGKLATGLQFATIGFVVLRRGPRRLAAWATGVCGTLAVAAYFHTEFASVRKSP